MERPDNPADYPAFPVDSGVVPSRCFRCDSDYLNGDVVVIDKRSGFSQHLECSGSTSTVLSNQSVVTYRLSDVVPSAVDPEFAGLSDDELMSTASSRIRAGYTFDPECHRTTYRLQATWHILATFGVEREVTHANGPVNDAGYGKHACSYECKTVLPEWLTDEAIDAAWNAACVLQEARGSHNRAEASIAKMSR